MKNNKGYFLCGYCKKRTYLEDDKIILIISGEIPALGYCSCGHKSHSSSIHFKAELHKKDWKGFYRGKCV